MPWSVTKHMIYGRNFRGFAELSIPLDGAIFLVGDNSSGKSSILHLISCVTKDNLESLPSLPDELSVGRYDYFSPYQDNADVTLGFEFENKSGRFGKLVTVRRQPKRRPLVISCSYFANGNVLTLLRQGDSMRKRIKHLPEDTSFQDFLSLHDTRKGFSALSNKRVVRSAPNSVTAIFEAGDPEEFEKLGIMNIVFGDAPKSRHIAPVRGLPERFYNLKRTLTPSGKHFAVLMNDLSSSGNKKGLVEIEKFGQESELFQRIEVEPLTTKVDEAPLIVRIQKNGRKFFLNQVGVGLSQVVPVLVETMLALTNDDLIVMFQQPELHLHPVAQAALGSFFFRTLFPEHPFVVETHSNFLIDRFRAEIRDSKKTTISGAKVLFCTNKERGNSCTIVDIANDGTLVNAPKEYFSFFVAELGRTMF